MRRIPYGNQSQWLAMRQNGIGASEAAQALGLEPSPLEIYNRKRGLEPFRSPTIPQRVGLALENLILRMYEEETGRVVNDTQILGSSVAHPFILATLDGMDNEGDIVECKSITPRRLRELGDQDLEQIPDGWNCQVQQQMYVAEKDRATVAVLIGNEDFRLYPVRRNETLIKMIVEAEVELWDRIQSRRPPRAMEDDEYGTVIRAYQDFTPAEALEPIMERMVRQAYQLGKIGSAIDKARDSVKARIAEWLGDREGATSPNGWAITRKKINRKAYTVEASSYIQLNLKPPKGEADVTVEGIAASIIDRLETDAPQGEFERLAGGAPRQLPRGD